MKLDRLRKRLRKDRPPPKAAKVAKRKVRLRCSKCRGPRMPASLTDPDVAEIIREHPSAHGMPEAAFRCTPCGIIWLVGPIVS
jgi:hypothetical protein